MKRILTAIIGGAITFSVVYGLAASLNLTTDSLGSGTTTVASCQATALNATYTSTYSATAPGYTVGTVTISSPADRAKAARYASFQTLGEKVCPWENARQ